MTRPRCCKDLPATPPAPQGMSPGVRFRLKISGATGVLVQVCKCSASCPYWRAKMDIGTHRDVVESLIELLP